MTATTPVERVAQLLEAAYFRRVPTPLQIAGLQIDVPGVFVGSEPSPDLVLVGDTAAQTPRHLRQAVEAVGRALDMMSSAAQLRLSWSALGLSRRRCAACRATRGCSLWTRQRTAPPCGTGSRSCCR